jgi:hypothetical protein
MGAKAHGLTELEADLRKAAEEAVPAAKKIAGKGSPEHQEERAADHPGCVASGLSAALPALDHLRGEGVRDPRVLGDRPGVDEAAGRARPAHRERQRQQRADPAPGPALDAEENVFYGYMEDLGEKLLEGDDRRPGGPVVDPGGG